MVPSSFYESRLEISFSESLYPLLLLVRGFIVF